MKTKIIKNSALSSAIVAVLVTIFAFGTINPAFASSRQDGPSSATNTIMGVTVGVELTGHYEGEPPAVNYYTSGIWHAWRSTQYYSFVGDFWIHFWTSTVDHAPNGGYLATDEIQLPSSAYDAQVLYAAAGTFFYDTLTSTLRYVSVSHSLTAHY